MAKRMEAIGPGEVQDYKIDWAERLASVGDDTLASSAWEVPDGFTASAQDYNDTESWLFIEAAADVEEGETLVVTNTVTTTGGREWIRRLLIPIDAR